MLSSPAGPSAGGPSQWQPGHMPRLSYRKASPDDEPDPLTRTSSHNDDDDSISPANTAPSNTTVSLPLSRAGKSRPTSQNTSTASRSATAAGTTRLSTAGTFTIANQSTKKRPSLFSGLFVKEPSSVALEQLAQKLIAEHGGLNARAIPGVSCATMPKNVPKVNSKWDGRPESTRLSNSSWRVGKAPKSTSSRSSARSRSAEPSDHRYPSSRGNPPELSQSSSTFAVNPDGAASQWSQPQTPTTDFEVYHPGIRDPLGANALGKMPRPRSARSQSLRSPSGSSLPLITAFFPEQITEPSALPPNFEADDNVHATLPIRSKPASRPKSRPQITTPPEPLADGSCDTMSLRSATSSEASPATPSSPYTPIRPADYALSMDEDRVLASYAQSKPEDVTLLSSGKNVLGSPVGTKRKVRPSRTAFLAGEARPMEIPNDSTRDPQNEHPEGLAVSGSPMLSNLSRAQKDLERRPDSSRARLGLRASMLVHTDAAPVLTSLARVQQDLEKRPDSSRARLGLRASMLVDDNTLPWHSQASRPDGGTTAQEATASSLKMQTSPKSKPKGFGIFGRDKVQK